MALSFPGVYFAAGFGICFCANSVSYFLLVSLGEVTVAAQVFYEILCLALKEFIYLFGAGYPYMEFETILRSEGGEMIAFFGYDSERENNAYI